MSAILAIAAKDLRVLFRVKAGLFFAFAWPLIIAVLFGAVFSGSGDSGPQGLLVALADEDQTPASRDFAGLIAKGGQFTVQSGTRTQAIDLVRRGKLAAALILPKGFGEASQRLFYGAPPQIEVWMDPSRKAESAMIQGLLFQRAAQLMQKKMADPGAMRGGIRDGLSKLNDAKTMDPRQRASLLHFLGGLDSALAERPANPAEGTGSQPAWQPLVVDQHDISHRRVGPQSGYDITFPQGLVWGILGCAMTFGIGFVSERTHGTLVRLQMAPIDRVQLLAGKALACAAACLLIEFVLCLVGVFGFHVVPQHWLFLGLACFSSMLAFVGVMMLVAGLGKTEQAAAGVGWAIMMPLSLFGGAMIPLAFMPHWMVRIGAVSPVRWSIAAFEGAIWRGFSFQEMLLPCGILAAIGIVCFVVGTRTLRLS
jgi:ABC-2 type transport system permease protein